MSEILLQTADDGYSTILRGWECHIVLLTYVLGDCPKISSYNESKHLRVRLVSNFRCIYNLW